MGRKRVHDIVCHERLTGTYVYSRSASIDAKGKRNGHKNKSDDEIIRIDGGMPAIISRQIFEKSMEKMKKNRSGKHKAKEPYLLSGLIFCGKCGGAMIGSSRGNPRTETEITKKYYECSTKRRPLSTVP